jgi:Trp operon repressor
MKPNAPAELAAILSCARNEDELAILLAGLLTPQEIEEAVVRWRLLGRLLGGQTQRDIAQELGISLGTIARGSRLLKYGPEAFRELVERNLRRNGDLEPTA